MFQKDPDVILNTRHQDIQTKSSSVGDRNPEIARPKVPYPSVLYRNSRPYCLHVLSAADEIPAHADKQLHKSLAHRSQQPIDETPKP